MGQSAFSQISRLQRIVLPAISETISAKGFSSVLNSFCYDPGRGGPQNLTSYKYVHFDGGSEVIIGANSTISIQQAIASGYIELNGSGYTYLKIKNNTNENIKIVTTKPSLFGDIKSDNANISEEILGLAKKGSVSTQGGSIATKSTQDLIWAMRKKIEVYKNEGLINSSSKNPTVSEIKNADEEFKKKYSITSENNLDIEISRKYSKIEQEERLKTVKIEVYKNEGLSWVFI